MAARRKSSIALDVTKIEEVIAKNGNVEAIVSVSFRDKSAPDGQIRFRLNLSDAENLFGSLQGALIGARTQNRRKQPS